MAQPNWFAISLSIVEDSGSFGHMGELLLPFLLPRSTLVTFLPIVIAS